MPIGSYAAVPLIADALIRRRPRSILDLGLGFGGAACIVRQWLDRGVQPWSTHLVGVEAWAEYRNPAWDLYDTIYTLSIDEFLVANAEEFDFILLCDVIEHLDKPAGLALIGELTLRLSHGGTLFIATPESYFEQYAAHGNPYEEHRSAWSREDFLKLDFSVQTAGGVQFVGKNCLVATWQR